jgi:D-methionine transport system ATP-binding protein
MLNSDKIADFYESRAVMRAARLHGAAIAATRPGMNHIATQPELEPAAAPAGEPTSPPVIDIQSVSQTFAGPDGPVHALRDVNLAIQPGEVFGVIGHSGAGKSTLVRALNLLNRPSAGKILLEGRDITALQASELRPLRRRIGMIFQHFNLLSSRTVAGNVALPLELAGVSKAATRERVRELLDLVDLGALADRYPSQISGGQKQRVGIARALANTPKVLLSDEATSALDPETTKSILELLKRINREIGLTIVLITHQMEAVRLICDRVAVMEKGRVVECGRVLDVFRAPRHAVTRALIGDVIAQDLPEPVLRRVRARLAARQPGSAREHLLRLAFTGGGVGDPLLSEVVRRFGLEFSILQGQITEIQEQAFGWLAILARGDGAQLRTATDYMRSRGVTVEELDHVLGAA